MGWGFRRSIKFGPLKLNFSKSGVGYSIGGRGFRVGQDAKGRSYTAASIPGTGLYSRTYSSQDKAAGGAAPLPGARPAHSASAALGFFYLLLAFGLGVLVMSIFAPHAVAPPVTPPAAVSVPVPPPKPVSVKRRRVHHSKPGTAPAIRQPAAKPETDGAAPKN